MNDEDLIPANRYNLLDFDQVRTFKTVLQDTYNSTLKTFAKYVFHCISQMDLRNKNPGTGAKIEITPTMQSKVNIWSIGYEHCLCCITIRALDGFGCNVRFFIELKDITPSSAQTMHLNILRSGQMYTVLQNLIKTEVDYIPELCMNGTPAVSQITACDGSSFRYLWHNYASVREMGLKAPLLDVRNDDELFNAIMTMTRNEMFYALVKNMYGVRPAVMDGAPNYKMVCYGMNHNLAVHPHMLNDFNRVNKVLL